MREGVCSFDSRFESETTPTRPCVKTLGPVGDTAVSALESFGGRT